MAKLRKLDSETYDVDVDGQTVGRVYKRVRPGSAFGNRAYGWRTVWLAHAYTTGRTENDHRTRKSAVWFVADEYRRATP